MKGQGFFCFIRSSSVKVILFLLNAILTISSFRHGAQPKDGEDWGRVESDHLLTFSFFMFSPAVE